MYVNEQNLMKAATGYLAGKVVLITGANHGIGAATATALATQNSSVFITYHRDVCRYSEEE